MAKKKRNAAKQASQRTDDAVRDDDDKSNPDAVKPETTQTQTSTGEDDDHEEALERYERGYQRDRLNQERAYEDLRFFAEEGQWETKVRTEREAEGRPILTINQCGQFVRQVSGDIRQMRPAIKCVPVDTAGDKQIAEKILPGMIRYIEQRSDAQGAYFAAVDQQATAGIGHWRVTTEYAGSSTFNQEIGIGTIEDGVGVIWDPDSVRPDHSDADWCFVPIDMSRATFKDKYPDKNADALPTVPAFFQSWYTDDHVRVAEYWRKVPCKRALALTATGAVIDLTDMDKKDRAAILAQDPPPRVEKRDSYCVQRGLISASDMIEPMDDWPGMHIPIVPLQGEEIKIGREIIRCGIIRRLKDVQRLYNYAISADAEAVALQPKAPYKGTRKNFEKYQDQWETANSKNWPYLEYEPDSANGGKAPEREAPPVRSTGIADLLNIATQDFSRVSGIYPAALGAQSNETSGKAIMARQREGDTGTYVYVANFARAIRRTGQIIVDLIPHIYDTEREIRIVGEDGKVDVLAINQPGVNLKTGLPAMLHDLTVGAYEVAIEMGPSFATKREEARDGMQTFMQTLGPQSAPLFIDLLAKMQDWPLSDQIAKRAKLMLPPQIQHAEAIEAGEPPPPPQPPSPQQQMEVEKHQAEMAKIQGDAQDADAQRQLDHRKLDVEMANINAELERARMEHTATMAGHAATVQAAQAGAQPGAQATDPRVDDLAQAVMQLRDVVAQVVQAIGTPPNQPQQGVPKLPPTGVPGVPGVPPVNMNAMPPGGAVPPQQGAPLQQ